VNGFTLPENANPADFFLDVISGQESRMDAASGVHSTPTAAELFQMWEAQRDSCSYTHANRRKSKFAHASAVQPLLRSDLERMYESIPKSQAGYVARRSCDAGSPIAATHARSAPVVCEVAETTSTYVAVGR
jgi:hypothetical protein